MEMGKREKVREENERSTSVRLFPPPTPEQCIQITAPLPPPPPPRHAFPTNSCVRRVRFSQTSFSAGPTRFLRGPEAGGSAPPPLTRPPHRLPPPPPGVPALLLPSPPHPTGASWPMNGARTMRRWEPVPRTGRGRRARGWGPASTPCLRPSVARRRESRMPRRQQRRRRHSLHSDRPLAQTVLFVLNPRFIIFLEGKGRADYPRGTFSLAAVSSPSPPPRELFFWGALLFFHARLPPSLPFA